MRIFKGEFFPRITGKQFEKKVLDEHETILRKSIDTMEAWLQTNKYLCGD